MDTNIDNVQFNEQSLQELVNYLSNVAYLMIDINKEILYKDLLTVSNLETIKNFATDRNTKMICISKLDGEDSNNFQIQVSSDLQYKNSKSSTCAFIKKETLLEVPNDTKTLASQIQVLNFSGEGNDTNVFSFMQNYIQNAFSPFFNSFQNSVSGGFSNESNKNIKSNTLQTLQNKMAELIFLLNQSQKNSDIPTVKLELEQDFKQILTDIRAKSKEPTVDDFIDKSNEDFILKLVNTINRWKVDISSVLKLDRQITQGNTLQEINFWKDYETTLMNSK